MSQEATSAKRRDLLRTSHKVSPVDNNLSKVTSVDEHFTFQARQGEKVRFSCQQGQWRA